MARIGADRKPGIRVARRPSYRRAALAAYPDRRMGFLYRFRQKADPGKFCILTVKFRLSLSP